MLVVGEDEVEDDDDEGISIVVETFERRRSTCKDNSQERFRKT